MFVLKTSPISIISPICVQINHLENGNKGTSSEAHLKSSKTSRSSYLDLKVSLCVKIFESIL